MVQTDSVQTFQPITVTYSGGIKSLIIEDVHQFIAIDIGHSQHCFYILFVVFRIQLKILKGISTNNLTSNKTTKCNYFCFLLKKAYKTVDKNLRLYLNHMIVLKSHERLELVNLN